MKKILAALLVLVFASTLVFADVQDDRTRARMDKIIATAEGYAYKIAAKYGSSAATPENQEKMAMLDDVWAEIKEMKEIRSKFESRRDGFSVNAFRQSVFELRATLTEIDREFNKLRNVPTPEAA